MLGNTNTNGEKVGVDAFEMNSSGGVRRSIDAILARRSRRLQARRESFAPDFLHGAAQLEEIYRTLGSTWVEQAVFVEPIYNKAGECLAVSIAYFNDYFLTIEQAVIGEVDDFGEWIDERTADRKTRVELVLSDDVSEEQGGFWGEGAGYTSSGLIPIFCSSERLNEMESGLLSVTRDGNSGDRERFEFERDAVLQDSRTNLLSLITLFSRLIAE